ncbi:MAG: haloalkane dehalogenase [Candidatus Hodarchaeota archaeon]
MNREIIRTPDSRFENLSGYNYAPHYIEIEGLRIHYVEEGNKEKAPIVLMHGEPSWCYLYRKMIPILTGAGHHIIAPDLVGFGRSDKFIRMEDYSYQMQVDVFTEFIKKLDLTEITLFCHDWGGLIGLRVVANEPDRFARIVATNTALPDFGTLTNLIFPPLFRFLVKRQGKVSDSEGTEEDKDSSKKSIKPFIRWVAYTKTAPEFPIGEIIQNGTEIELAPDVLAAYEAPFPDDSYKAGARIMPSLVPSQLKENHKAWKKVFYNWNKPFLTTFSDMDPVTRGRDEEFQTRIPGSKGLPHTTIKGAGHFLQEEKGEELANILLEFIKSTSN